MSGITLQLDTRPPQPAPPSADVLQFPQTQVDALAAYVRRAWDVAFSARSEVTVEIKRARWERELKYEPSFQAELNAIKSSDIFLGVTDHKCRMVAAWLRDLLLAQNEKPWGIDPTARPDLPKDFDSVIEEAIGDIRKSYTSFSGEQPTDDWVTEYRMLLRQQVLEQIQEEAKEIAERMENAIEDVFTEGGYYKALYDAMDDIATYPSAIIEGPILVRKPVLAWVKNSSGRWEVKTEKKLKVEWRRVDPYVVYPGPNSCSVNDRYLCRVRRITRRELEEMRGTPGVDETRVLAALKDHALGGLQNWLALWDDLKNEFEYTHAEATFDMLEYWGDIDGYNLIHNGIIKDINPNEVYSVCLSMIGTHVIKARLNFHPLGHKPYYVTSFDKRSDSFWGRSPPMILRPIQQGCNAAARALVNNLGIASGPQVDVNIDRMPAGQNLDTMFPWKHWQTRNDPFGRDTPALRFWQPDSRSSELTTVHDFFSELADQHLGMPRFLTGQEPPAGAGRTASGLSMLLNNANKFIKQVVLNVDADLIEAPVREQYIFLMLYGEDNSIKGDSTPRARGAISLSIRESTQQRRSEFLAATSNPIDSQIMGTEGRAALLRENAKALDMDIDKIVPPGHVEKILNQLQGQPTPQFMLDQQAQQGAPGQQQGFPAGQTSIHPQLPVGGNLGSQEQLADGAPVTDFFSNRPAVPVPQAPIQ